MENILYGILAALFILWKAIVWLWEWVVNKLVQFIIHQPEITLVILLSLIYCTFYLIKLLEKCSGELEEERERTEEIEDELEEAANRIVELESEIDELKNDG